MTEYYALLTALTNDPHVLRGAALLCLALAVVLTIYVTTTTKE